MKTKTLLFTFAVEGVINSEILRSFTELLSLRRKSKDNLVKMPQYIFLDKKDSSTQQNVTCKSKNSKLENVNQRAK